MAAGAYKGLTIRIGADVTKLSTALRGADSAIYKTQQQLNKLSKAAKIDPGNSLVKNAQIGALAAQATNAAREIALLKNGIEDLASKPVLNKLGFDTGKTVGSLASNTESAKLAAEEALVAYTNIDKELMNASKHVKELTGVDLSKATKEGNFEDETQRALKIAREQGKSIEADLVQIRSLKYEWQEARNNLDAYSDVSKLQDLNTKLAEQDAGLKKIAADLAEVNKGDTAVSTSSIDKSVEALNGRMALVTAAAQTAREQFDELDNAAKLDPTNIDLAQQRANALAKSIELAKKQSELLQQKIDSYEAQGIDKVAKSVDDVGMNLEETKQRWSDAEDKVAELTVRLQVAEGASEVTSTALEGVGKSNGGINQTAESVEDLSHELELAKQEAAEAKKEFDQAKAVSEYEELKGEVDNVNRSVAELAKSFGGLRVQSSIASSGAFERLSREIELVSSGLDTARGRFEAFGRAAQIKPHSLRVAVEHIRSMREAVDVAQQKAQLLRDKLESYKSAGIDRLSNYIGDAAVEFEKAQANVNRLQQELAEANEESGEGSARARELEAALKAAMESAKTAAAVNEYRNLKAELADVETQAKSMNDSMKASFGDVGAAAVVAAEQIGQMAERAWSSISTSAKEVDEAYRDLRKTFNAEEDEYQALYDAAMAYSQTHVTSADSMLEMEAIAAQVGVGMKGGAEGIQMFAEAAANLDVATDITSDEIALKMGQMINIMDDFDVTEVERFSDALVRLGNNMPAQESAIMEVAQRMASQSNIIGMSTPQVLGWSAAIASTGQHSEAAATAMSRTMAMIEAAVAGGTESLTKFEQQAGFSASSLRDLWNADQAAAIEQVGEIISSNADALDYFAQLTNQTAEEFQFAYEDKADEATLSLVAAIGDAQDKLQRFAEISNKSADEFAEDWANDPSTALQEFVQGLANIDERGESLESALGDIGIKAVRQKQGLESLTKTIDIVGDSITMSGDAWNGVSDDWGQAGDAANEASRKAEGFSGSLSKMQNSAKVLAATIGPSLIPTIDWIADKLQWLTEVVDNMSDDTKDKIVKTAGAFMVFSTVTPVVRTLGKSFLDFTSGTLSFLINAIARAQVAMSGMGGSFFALEEASKGAMMAKFGTGLQTILTSGLLVKGAIVGLAGVIASYYVKKAIDAYKHTKEMNAALSGMRDNANDIGRALWNGSDNVKSFGDASKTAAGKVSDLLQVVSEHNQKNAETRDTAETSIAMLGKYKEIIDECAGAGEVSAEKMGLLEWALSGLSEVTGEQYDANAILKDSYEDEEGAVHNLRDEIDKLIETKKREAKIDALKAMYTDALETQMKLKKGYDQANADLQEYVRGFKEAWRQVSDEQGLGLTEADIVEKMFNDEGYQKFEQAANDANELWRASIEEANAYADAMGGVITEQMTAADAGDHVREGMMRTNEVMSQSLDKVWDGADKYRELATAIMDAGVSADDFAKINENSFAAMVEASGGDIQTLANMIAEYNALPVDVKEADFTFDGEGLVDADGARLEWNGSEWKSFEVTAEVTGNSVDGKAKKNIDETNKSQGRMRNTNVTAKVGGNAATTKTPATNINAVNTASGDMKDVTATYTANGNAASNGWSIAGGISAIVNAARGLVSKTITLITNQKTVKSTVTVPGNSATGAYVPYNKVPRHAAGIFTRPTLTNIGWVGEDGAELYSGNSLVPLTNRKYSMPYINDISDAVAKKMGGAGSTTTITLHVNCDGGPEETANAIVRALKANRF